ncbi:hypothetical protein M3212_21555 [Alkalihalobacillus oceani]|uniref:hypothetical protein n=1 Tax=Halalkalibacter oceani TaxID=1653776 RepID=UPI002041129C|nr:hypothetical protein [Halalkalibacter oceani]MCM3763296.1 hypothetical protein [Halalkalibacter oceani]
MKDIATLMEPSPKKTSQWVEKRVSQCLKKAERKLTKEEDYPYLDNLLRYSKGFWKGLFTCYDHPSIPRTNNDLELFFRRTKQQHRRITGSRTWNRYIIRHGENIVFTANIKGLEHGLNTVEKISYDGYRKEAKAWEKRIYTHTKQRRFKKAPNEYLNNLETKWLRHN